jgi:hypothetical protein
VVAKLQMSRQSELRERMRQLHRDTAQHGKSLRRTAQVLGNEFARIA